MLFPSVLSSIRILQMVTPETYKLCMKLDKVILKTLLQVVEDELI